MKKQLIFLLLVCFSLSARIIPHYCVHDQISQEIDDRIITVEEDKEFRDLQANQVAKQIRITYDVNFLETLKNTTTGTKIRDNAEKALKVALKYFSDQLMVFPKLPGSLIFNKTMCHNYYVPQFDTQQDKKDRDSHLQISSTLMSFNNHILPMLLLVKLQIRQDLHMVQLIQIMHFQKHTISKIQLFLMIWQKLTHKITHALGFSNWMIPQSQLED